MCNVVHILHMRKLRFRNTKCFTQNHEGRAGVQIQICMNLALEIIDIVVSEQKAQLISVPFSHISHISRKCKGFLILNAS